MKTPRTSGSFLPFWNVFPAVFLHGFPKGFFLLQFLFWVLARPFLMFTRREKEETHQVLEIINSHRPFDSQKHMPHGSRKLRPSPTWSLAGLSPRHSSWSNVALFTWRGCLAREGMNDVATAGPIYGKRPEIHRRSHRDGDILTKVCWKALRWETSLGGQETTHSECCEWKLLKAVSYCRSCIWLAYPNDVSWCAKLVLFD